ncbi:MAG: hypothetical protein JO000_12680 [Alphaproteobacteria bacterium]|nr:hypothetical protein [Alphaproteobacteria bacterium]
MIRFAAALVAVFATLAAAPALAGSVAFFPVTSGAHPHDVAAAPWKSWPLPKSRSGCYTVHVDETDKVWVSDFTANAILRFDPATEKFESFPSDKSGASVRQMFGRRGEAWGAESGTDRLVVVRY